MNSHDIKPVLYSTDSVAALIIISSGIVAAMHIGKVPPALPAMQRALGLSLVETGFLVSMVQMLGMLFGVLAGRLCDLIGGRKSLVIGQSILAIASLAALVTTSVTELLVLRALEGAGFLLVVLPAPKLIRSSLDESKLSIFLGLWGTYMGIGIAISLLVGSLFANGSGWQGYWLLLGVTSLVTAYLVAKQVPAETSMHIYRQQHDAGFGAVLAETLKSTGPWSVSVAFAMYSTQWLVVIGFLPSIYIAAGISPDFTGIVTGLVCLANVIGSLYAGRLLFRGLPIRLMLAISYIGMAITGFFIFSVSAQQMIWVNFCCALLFSAFSGLVPATLFLAAIRVSSSNQNISTTVGFMQQCSSFGQFAGPPIVGWMVSQYEGWEITWVITTLLSFVGLMLSIFGNFRSSNDRVTG
ncbi:MAG: transporter [Proteobacteria bacterium]|nr:transporter [Pseudomonadota bacterium]